LPPKISVNPSQRNNKVLKARSTMDETLAGIIGSWSNLLG
jgi:hypothetical protein